MLNFLEQERERIAKLNDDEEGWQAWCEHYRELSPKEQAVAQYILAAERKEADAEEYLGIGIGPINCVAQSDVNEGFGMMFSIKRDCFLFDDAKLFYVRSDMWIPPHHDPEPVPEWITRMAEDCKKYSSGLTRVRPEIISYSFDDDPPCSYYAITFQLDAQEIRKSVRIGDGRWWPKQIGPYLFTLLDITGEYDYVIGELSGGGPVALWHEPMDFR